MFTATYPDTRSAFAHVQERDCGVVRVTAASTAGKKSGDRVSGKPRTPVELMLGGGRKSDRLQGRNSVKISVSNGLQLHTEAQT